MALFKQIKHTFILLASSLLVLSNVYADSATETVVVSNKTKAKNLFVSIKQPSANQKGISCPGFEPQGLEPYTGSVTFNNISTCGEKRYVDVSFNLKNLHCINTQNNSEELDSHLDYRFTIDYNDDASLSCLGTPVTLLGKSY